MAAESPGPLFAPTAAPTLNPSPNRPLSARTSRLPSSPLAKKNTAKCLPSPDPCHPFLAFVAAAFRGGRLRWQGPVFRVFCAPFPTRPDLVGRPESSPLWHSHSWLCSLHHLCVLGQVLKHWWHVPGIYYLVAFVFAPLSYIREWWR